MKKLISLVVVLVLALSLSTAMADLYPRAGVVTSICDDVVTIKDAAGIRWQFDGPEDLLEGDVVSTIMGDNGTPEYVYDDIIVDWAYSGFSIPVIDEEVVK